MYDMKGFSFSSWRSFKSFKIACAGSRLAEKTTLSLDIQIPEAIICWKSRWAASSKNDSYGSAGCCPLPVAQNQSSEWHSASACLYDNLDISSSTDEASLPSYGLEGGVDSVEAFAKHWQAKVRLLADVSFHIAHQNFQMHNILSRINNVSTFLSSCMMTLLVAIAISSFLLTADPKGELAISSVKVCVAFFTIEQSLNLCIKCLVSR